MTTTGKCPVDHSFCFLFEHGNENQLDDERNEYNTNTALQTVEPEIQRLVRAVGRYDADVVVIKHTHSEKLRQQTRRRVNSKPRE